MKDAKRSKLEIISRFDLQSMFCAERYPSFYFRLQQFSSSKSKLEDFMQGYFSFFRKIFIEALNINSLLKGGLFCKIETRVS